MEFLDDLSDSRNKAWCVNCGDILCSWSSSWDHVPSKALLTKPLPAHPPKIKVCKRCNESFAADEEYLAAFLGTVLAGTADPAASFINGAGPILASNKVLQRRIAEARSEEQTPDGEARILWTAEWDRIYRVITKNARGHACFELGEPMLHQPVGVSALPMEMMSDSERRDFETVYSGSLLPEVGSRMLSRILTNDDLVDGWIVVQQGIYRYAVLWGGAFIVRSVIYEYLATEVHWSSDV